MTSVPSPLELEDVPGGPEAGTRLVRVADIPSDGGYPIDFTEGRKRFEMFIIRDGQDVRAFHNKCPHASTRLDVFGSGFYEPSGSLLECGTHSAKFEPGTGLCVSGPCKGRYLRQVAVKVDADGWVVSA